MYKKQILFYKNTLLVIAFLFALALVVLAYPAKYGYGQTNTTPGSSAASLVASPQEGNRISISVKTSGRADQVLLSSFVGEGTGVKVLLGAATRVNDTDWRYTWDVSAVPAGVHRVFAVVVRGTSRTESAAISITVGRNTGTGSGTTATTTTGVGGLPLPIPPVITPSAGTDDGTTAQNLDTLSEIINNSVTTFNEETTGVVQQTREAIDSVASKLPSTVATEKEAITADITKLVTDTRNEVRDGVLGGTADSVETIRQNFETESGVYIKRLEDLAKNAGTVIDTGTLKQTLTDTIDQVVAGAKQVELAFQERGGILLYIDSDRDNVSDYDEKNIYKTDPQAADTDNDGATDGDEILRGTNPLSANTETVSYADPNVSGTRTSALSVTAATVVETQVVNGVTTAKKIRFEGRALPNSFVTLFVFSTPVVVTVKADTEGKWTYIYDKELADGSHTMFVSMVDTTGKILAKSAPTPFVKQAAAVELISPGTVSETPSLISTNSIILIVGAVVIFGILSLVYISYQHKKKEEEIRKLGGTTF